MPKNEQNPVPVSVPESASVIPQDEEMTREDWLALLPAEEVDNPIARAYVLYSRSIGRIAYFHTRNPDAREEAPQEIFRRLVDPDLKSALPGDSEDNDEAYLNGAATNYARDILRRKKRLTFYSMTGFENVYEDKSPEEMADSDLATDINKAGSVLWDVAAGLSYEEIAEKEDQPKSTVKMRLYRAREKLKKISSEARAYADEVKSSQSMQRVPVESPLSDKNPQEDEE